MKKYLVMSYVNGDWCVSWEFETLEYAKAAFDAKVSALPIDMKRENQQAVKKLHDTDCWGYELDSADIDDDNVYRAIETIESDCMSWKEAKERLENEKVSCF